MKSKRTKVLTGQPRIMRGVIPEKRNGEDQTARSSREETNLLVVTLIATVSFAAGIAVPGGFTSEEPHPGTAILTKKAAFQAFLIFDSIAMFVSVTTLYFIVWKPRFAALAIARYEKLGTALTFFASCFMVFAFGLGVYVVVLSQAQWMAILICCVCFSIPFLSFFVKRAAEKIVLIHASKKEEDC